MGDLFTRSRGRSRGYPARRRRAQPPQWSRRVPKALRLPARVVRTPQPPMAVLPFRWEGKPRSQKNALFGSRVCLSVFTCDPFMNAKLIHLHCANEDLRKSKSKKIKITHKPVSETLSLQSIIISKPFLYLLPFDFFRKRSCSAQFS